MGKKNTYNCGESVETVFHKDTSLEFSLPQPRQHDVTSQYSRDQVKFLALSSSGVSQWSGAGGTGYDFSSLTERLS